MGGKLSVETRKKIRFVCKNSLVFSTQKQRGRTLFKTKTFQLSVTENQKAVTEFFVVKVIVSNLVLRFSRTFREEQAVLWMVTQESRAQFSALSEVYDKLPNLIGYVYMP